MSTALLKKQLRATRFINVHTFAEYFIFGGGGPLIFFFFFPPKFPKKISLFNVRLK